MNYTMLETGIIFTMAGLLVIAASFGSKENEVSPTVGSGTSTARLSSDPIRCDAYGNYTIPEGMNLTTDASNSSSKDALSRGLQMTISVKDYEKAVGGDWEIEKLSLGGGILWKHRVTGAGYYTGDIFPPKH